MTKILHIPSGEYVRFVSSVSWDKAHGYTCADQIRVIDFEDSFSFIDRSDKTMAIRQFLVNELLTGRESLFSNDNINETHVLEEFEIIYD